MTPPRKPSNRGGGRPYRAGPPGRGDRAGPGRSFARGAGTPTRAPGRVAGARSAQPTPRDCVHRLLSSQCRRFPELEIAELHTTGLDERDASLAHAIYDTVLRRWLTLRHLLTAELNVPWEDLHPKIAAALLAGAAQIVFFDKVPAHAATDEAVKWAKQAGARSGGLVNAVLRALIARLGGKDDGIPRDVVTLWTPGRTELPLATGGALRFRTEILPADPMQALSIATSHPVELLRQWSRHMPMLEVRRLALHGLASAPVILNTSYAASELPAKNLSPHSAPGHHVFTGTRSELSALLDSRRDLWVQDSASSLAVSSVSDLAPALIIDACAGMGTKSRQIAATFPSARVIATDIDTVRLGALRESVRAVRGVEVVPYEKLRDFVGQADLVVLDVPCSNTAVLARRVEARYRYERARQEKLASMQKQIIADSIPLLKGAAGPGPRGAILYSTCSLDPLENEDQARWAAKWHMFKITREHRRLPGGGPGDPPESYSDGSYAVLLQ